MIWLIRFELDVEKVICIKQCQTMGWEPMFDWCNSRTFQTLCFFMEISSSTQLKLTTIRIPAKCWGWRRQWKGLENSLYTSCHVGDDYWLSGICCDGIHDSCLLRNGHLQKGSNPNVTEELKEISSETLLKLIFLGVNQVRNKALTHSFLFFYHFA